MKQSILFTSLLLTVAARADLVMSQKVEGPMPSTTVTTIKGEKMRVDAGKDTTMIIDTKSGDTTTYMHTQKMMIKMDGAAVKAQAAAMATNKDASTEPTFTATGTKEKVGEHECEIYDYSINGMKMKLWIAKDYPDYDKIKKDMAASMASMKSPSGKVPEFPGMALKTEMEMMGQKIISTVTSVKTDAVDDSAFTGPTGYTALPGAGGK